MSELKMILRKFVGQRKVNFIMQRKDHPLQIAEPKLQNLGIRHAPIQGFLEGDGIDGRFVTLMDEPGPYYLLGGVDNRSDLPEDDGKIQILFLSCKETAAAIADHIGWAVEKIEQLPTVSPFPEGVDSSTTVTSAILVNPA